MRIARTLTATFLIALTAVPSTGCGGPAEPPRPAGPPASAEPRSSADVAACARHAQTATLVRRELDTYGTTAVPPVRIALVLSASWTFYHASGAQDPALAAAMSEVAAAIGDLDAQAKAEVPAGGSLLEPVRLDPARAQAAVRTADRACTGRTGDPPR